MNKYKWSNKEQTHVLQYPSTYIFENGKGWSDFQKYLAGGGQVDPWKTMQEIVEDTKRNLWMYHDILIDQNTIGLLKSKNANRDNAWLNRALRKEAKGELLNQKDLKILDVNDILCAWFDDLEIIAEEQENWIEDPARTDQELINYDPETANWPGLSAV